MCERLMSDFKERCRLTLNPATKKEPSEMTRSGISFVTFPSGPEDADHDYRDGENTSSAEIPEAQLRLEQQPERSHTRDADKREPE
jgi:hypothetical protein